MRAWSPGDPPLALQPIGIVHSAFAEKAEAPRQPCTADGEPGRIELFPGRNYEHALDDLQGWDHLWVIYCFHLNNGWRPKVLPPRSTTGRKGVFSTRSPHRPNPLGLSVLRLERVEGLVLHVRDVDMVDGTPVLDIKPYVPYTDARPDARSGWLEASDPVAAWEVVFEPLAEEQARWIEAHTGFAIATRISTALRLGPKPNPYRRIRPDGDAMRLAIKDWRIRFVAAGRVLRVQAIASGYRPGSGPGHHAEFSGCWPVGGKPAS